MMDHPDDLPDDPHRPTASQVGRYEAMLARLALGNLRQWTADQIGDEFDLLRHEVDDIAHELADSGELPLFLQQLAIHLGSTYVRLAEASGLSHGDAVHLVRRPTA